MLRPEDIDAIANDITNIYDGVIKECVKTISTRISAGKAVTQASVWHLKKLNDVGLLKRDLLKAVSKETRMALPEVEALVETALSKSVGLDVDAIRRGLSKYKDDTYAERIAKMKNGDEFKRILKSATAGCRDVLNLTGTKAVEGSLRAYTDAINIAYLEMASGNYTYEQAVERAVGRIGKSGIKIEERKGEKVTTYNTRNGVRTYPLDSAIRRDLTTAINQACGSLTLEACGDMDCELVETSWHIGARPEHEVWQGRIFSLKQNDTRYPYFYASQEAGGTGYGDMLGLCGINCRHSFNPYFEGSPRSTQEGKPTKEENDKAYKEQQQQRAYERNLRGLKREQMAYQSAGMTEKAQAVQRKVNDMSARYKQFLKDTGRTRVSMLDKVGGYKRISTKAGATVPTATTTTTAPNTSRIRTATPKPKAPKVEIAGVSQGKPMSFDEANELRGNPNFYLGGGYRVNCQTCVVANEARRRGYDVEALKKNSVSEMLSYSTNKAWIDPKTKTTPMFLVQDASVNTVDKLYDWLNKSVEEGNRYHIGFAWKGRGNSGHIICIDKVKGSLRLYDPQSGRKYTSEDYVRRYLGRMKLETTHYGRKYKVDVELLRVDNLDFDKSVVDAILKKATTK